MASFLSPEHREQIISEAHEALQQASMAHGDGARLIALLTGFKLWVLVGIADLMHVDALGLGEQTTIDMILQEMR